MASLDTGLLPTSLEEVESLVLQLYQPGAPEKVARTQETLQRLQRSSEGWQLAHGLLASKEESVRFFGALTFIVKLNTDSKSLSEDDATALLQNLLGWLIRRLDAGEGALVVRKLCSTLVAYFLQFSVSWTRCIKHLTYCLCLGQTVSYEALGDEPNSAVLIQSISNDKAVAILWFATTLVEEVGKTDSNSMKQHKFHERVVPNVEDVIPIIERYVVNQSSAEDVKVRQEAMRCFQAWVSYSHRAFVDDEIVLDPLRTLTKPAIMCLADNDLYEITIELFSDVLSNYSRFLHNEDMTLLYALFNSPWARERYERLINGDYDFDSIQFGLFMLAFGDATVVDLAQKAGSDSQCQQFLSALCGLLGAEGFIVNEDKIFVPALEFWNTFVETMIDFTYTVDGRNNPPWFQEAQKVVMQVIKTCWQKIQFPPNDAFSTWDSIDRTGFKDARRDVLDLLQQFYLIEGISLLDVFINLSQQSIKSGNWTELEASMYCLASFADCITGDENRDEYLSRIFEPSVFVLFTNSPADVPTRAMQTFLTLIQHYPDHFRRKPENLPSALNIAFGALRFPILARTASRTIVDLCSDCRNILIPELGAFLQQLSSMTFDSVEGSAKEGVMEGIASIIQAIEYQTAQIAPLAQLLSFIDVDVEQCLRLLSLNPVPDSDNSTEASSNYAAAAEIGLTALRSLESVAKGLRTPADRPVDLERSAEKSPFWINGEGSVIQQRIMSTMDRIFDALRGRGEIVEACCWVFRRGFGEREPGPFVLPAGTVAQFLVQADSQTPRIGLVIGTACSLMSSYKSGDRIDEPVDLLLKWLIQLLLNLGEPSNDPEIAQNGIDFLSRLIPVYLGTLLNQSSSSLEYLFVFTLKALTGNDPLPKIASADFWSYLVGIPTQASPIQDAIETALQQLGPLLAQALIYNIGGNAARSELDKISDPLKKLVVRQLRSKNWLEAALLGDSFPSDKVTSKDKTIFLQKIMSLRGAKGTNQVVKDFWLACRGSNFAYAS